MNEREREIGSEKRDLSAKRKKERMSEDAQRSHVDEQVENCSRALSYIDRLSTRVLSPPSRSSQLEVCM